MWITGASLWIVVPVLWIIGLGGVVLPGRVLALCHLGASLGDLAELVEVEDVGQLERFLDEGVDVLVVDLSSLGERALDLVGEIKARRKGKDVQVLAVWDGSNGELLKRALEVGCSDFVRRELLSEELLLRVSKLLALKEQLSKIRALAKEMAILQEQVERLANVDPLTGLDNRRRGFELWAGLHRRSLKQGTPYWVVLMDVDRFKAYNDLYGHRAGDRALAAVGRAIAATLGPKAFPFRYGGEEFCALVKGPLGIGELKELVEGLLRAVWGLGIEHAGNPPYGRVTLSAGASASVGLEGDRGIDEVLKRADEALYLAKERGRNRLEIAL